jgi:hypothetical protein
MCSLSGYPICSTAAQEWSRNLARVTKDRWKQSRKHVATVQNPIQGMECDKSEKDERNM